MNAILIDPVDRKLELVEHSGGLRSICALVQCSSIDAVRLERGAAIYVDDEGLLVGPRPDLWKLSYQTDDGETVWTHWLAGRGLLVGTTRGGKDAKTPFSIAEIEPRIRWRPSWIAAARRVVEERKPGIVLIPTGQYLVEDRLPASAGNRFILDLHTARALVSMHDLLSTDAQIEFSGMRLDQAVHAAMRWMQRTAARA